MINWILRVEVVIGEGNVSGKGISLLGINTHQRAGLWQDGTFSQSYHESESQSYHFRIITSKALKSSLRKQRGNSYLCNYEENRILIIWTLGESSLIPDTVSWGYPIAVY